MTVALSEVHGMIAVKFTFAVHLAPVMLSLALCVHGMVGKRKGWGLEIYLYYNLRSRITCLADVLCQHQARSELRKELSINLKRGDSFSFAFLHPFLYILRTQHRAINVCGADFRSSLGFCRIVTQIGHPKYPARQQPVKLSMETHKIHVALPHLQPLI